MTPTMTPMVNRNCHCLIPSNEHCYMPLHISEGLSGKLITTILRPGRRNKQANVAKLLKKLISYLRKQWPKTRIIVRGDSHFASQDFMDWSFVEPDVDFITGLTGNTKLHELARVTIESAEREFKQHQKPVDVIIHLCTKPEHGKIINGLL